MLLAAWAMTRPRSASAKYPQRGATAVAAASSPPISAEVSVMLKTQARVMRSQRETPSIARPLGRLPVAMIWRQLSSSVPKPGVASSPGTARVSAMAGPLGGRARRINPASSRRQGGHRRGRRGPEGTAERSQENAPPQGRARRPAPVETLRQEGRRDRGGRHALSIDRIEGAHRVADGEEAVEALRPALVVPEAVRHGAVRVDGGDRLGELDRVRDDRGAEPGERGAEPRLVARRVVAGDAGDGHDPAPALDREEDAGRHVL